MAYAARSQESGRRFFNPMMWDNLYEAGLAAIRPGEKKPAWGEPAYTREEIREALGAFCSANDVRCGACRTFFNGIGRYCRGSQQKPKARGPGSKAMEQAVKELEALWYLPRGKRQNHRENEWYLSVILNSRRLKLMKSKVFREAMEMQIEMERDSSPYEPPEGLG